MERDGEFTWLVVWNMFFFSIQLGIIIPTDELIFFRGVGIPPTSYICFYLFFLMSFAV